LVFELTRGGTEKGDLLVEKSERDVGFRMTIHSVFVFPSVSVAIGVLMSFFYFRGLIGRNRKKDLPAEDAIGSCCGKKRYGIFVIWEHFGGVSNVDMT